MNSREAFIDAAGHENLFFFFLTKKAKVCEKKGECYSVMETRFHAYCGGTYMYMNLLHVGLGPQMTEDENFCFTN